MHDDSIKLANREYNVGIDSNNITSLPLYDFIQPTSFQEYLMSNRIKPFIMMKMLYHLFLEGIFIIGHEKTTYTLAELEKSFNEEYDGDHVAHKQEELGASIIMKEYTGKELFYKELQQQGFLQVLIKDEKSFIFQERKTLKKTVIVDSGVIDEYSDDTIYIQTKPFFIAITPQRIYYHSDTIDMATKIVYLLDYHKLFFDIFLKEYADKCVDHELYVHWLLTWFPGMITVKSVE